MAELSNCKNCGRVFVRVASPYCPECLKEQDRLFDLVYKYITSKEHRMATVPEVHEETGVSADLIYQWVREGRLTTSMFPNLGYPCKSCGTLIQTGVVCESCRTKIEGELRRADEEKKVSQKNQESITYHTRNSRF
ncbi:TIGR03826 family flagellar region protein [Sporolactobacillus spathodeae]|uniref:Flagellar operon protein (TIGR03826 family) n=1 Tax=Sporolactobacillus spathodeae TaxID=1465502 RepID=A0ABS2Q662_9BACL|nr:TIGR03826 family flagellar region protein [Sporolactobacillus spathodeae]MBM7657263.1 flagellar operon protein (TIGR03826 family) [Sporolactobacillus spathodeae]